MAQPTNIYSSYDAAGNKEDITDIICNIDPDETPVLSACKRIKAKNRVHQWQSQALAAAAANQQIEGDTISLSAPTATTVLNNVCQLSHKAIGVTSTQEAIEHYGRDSELGYVVGLAGQELKRDMENDLTANVAKVTGNDSTARKMAGLVSWIKTNVDKASDGSNPTGDGTDTRTNGTQRAFAESQLRNALNLAFSSGAKPKMAVVGAFNKQAFTGFTGAATKTIDAQDRSLYASVDVYFHDFGKLNVVPDLFSRSRDCLLLDPDWLRIAYLQPMSTFALAKVSHSDQRVVAVEYTLDIGSEKAHAGVFDLTTS